MSCVFSPSAACKSVQWQVKPEELHESRVCVSVLLRCPYLGLVRMKRNFRIAVFFMEMEFLVPGQACPVWAVAPWFDFCWGSLCLPHSCWSRAGLGLLAGTKPRARLGFRQQVAPNTFSQVFLQQEGVGEPESALVSGKLSHLSLVKASISKVIIPRWKQSVTSSVPAVWVQILISCRRKMSNSK